MQMIPAVRTLLSTSWDPEIRRALAEKRAKAGKTSAARGQRADADQRGNTTIGTMLGEDGEDAPKGEGEAGASGEVGDSGDAGGGGGGGDGDF